MLAATLRECSFLLSRREETTILTNLPCQDMRTGQIPCETRTMLDQTKCPGSFPGRKEKSNEIALI